MSERVEITSLAFGGKGVGRIGGKVVFVPYSAPGDVAQVEVVSQKKGYSEGVIERIEVPSTARVEPLCPLYGECGGCNLQHMGYKDQLHWKQRILEETIRRIGKAEGIIFEEPIASPMEFNYRARARFQAEGGRAGFFGARSHSVVDMEGCPLLDPIVNETFSDIRKFLKGPKRPRVGSFEVGLSEGDMKTVAVFHVDGDDHFNWAGLLEGVRHLKGIEVWASPEKGRHGRFVSSAGDTGISYSIEGIEIRARASVFSQVNRLQNRNMVGKAIEFAAPTGAELVVDLFSGVGNLTLPFARRSREVAGIEQSHVAVRQARENAAKNSIKNVYFHASDSASWLKQNLKSLEKEMESVLVLDPPRGGEPQIAKSLSGARPAKILYISCSPPTLARDISALAGCGYRVSRAVLIDMFPQTYHIESVIGLELA